MCPSVRLSVRRSVRMSCFCNISYKKNERFFSLSLSSQRDEFEADWSTSCTGKWRHLAFWFQDEKPRTLWSDDAFTPGESARKSTFLGDWTVYTHLGHRFPPRHSLFCPFHSLWACLKMSQQPWKSVLVPRSKSAFPKVKNTEVNCVQNAEKDASEIDLIKEQ